MTAPLDPKVVDLSSGPGGVRRGDRAAVPLGPTVADFSSPTVPRRAQLSDPVTVPLVSPTPTRWRLDLAYDGAGFAGWAKQPRQRTVQAEVELRLTRLLRLDHPVELTVAGRTDAGVHARGQVCHFDRPAASPASLAGRGGEPLTVAEAIRRWLPRALPSDIALRGVSLAPPGFDARFSASFRRYVYRLADDPLRLDPLVRGFVTPVPALDVDRMVAAAERLLGLRDFTALSKARPGATAIRHLSVCRPERVGPGRIDITLVADAFAHSMVRSIVGALCLVGQGRRDADWLGELLQRRSRAGEVRVFPAAGLTLEEVGYPPDAELAQRAQTARQVRQLPAATAVAEPPSRLVAGESPCLSELAAAGSVVVGSPVVGSGVGSPAASPARAESGFPLARRLGVEATAGARTGLPDLKAQGVDRETLLRGGDDRR